MTTATVTPAPDVRVRFTRALLAGLIATAIAVVANLAVRWIGLLIVPVPADFTPLATLQPTILFTTLFLVIATILYALINQFARHPLRVWRIVAWTSFIITLIPDLMLLFNPSSIPMPLGTVTPGAILILLLMHVVAFAIIMWVFLRWAPEA